MKTQDQMMPKTLRPRDRLIHGVSNYALESGTRRGEVVRVHRGIYVRVDSPEADDDETRTWHAVLVANLERGGPTSAISHSAAAALHRLDGFSTRTFDITVPLSCGWKTKPAIRSRTLSLEDTTLVHGVRCTSVKRTLFDLASRYSTDQVELALESALRDSDRSRPDTWNDKLLADLRFTASRQRTPSALRFALERRDDHRPTGSYAETILWQALRRNGVEGFVRQPAVVATLGGNRKQTYFPDFADFSRGVLVEVDGLVAHGTPAQIDRDDHRQNILNAGFRILRFFAKTVLKDPDGSASTIREAQQSMPLRARSFTTNGVVITHSGTGATMTKARTRS